MTDTHATLPTAPQNRFQDDGDEIDLRALLSVILGARGLIAGFTVAALVLGGLYAWIATPIYEVDASVQVEDNKGSGLGTAVKDLDGLFEGKSQATTEIELLRSRMVLGRALDTLNLDIVALPDYFPVIGRAIARRHEGISPAVGWPGFTGFAWGGEVIKITRLQVPPEWEGKTLTLTARANNRYALYSPAGELLGEGRVGEEFVPSLGQGRIGLFVRELKASENVDFGVTKRPRLSTISRLQQQFLAIEKGSQSGIIQLSLKGPDAALAVATLNTIANQYVRQNVERKSAEAEQTLKYLDQQLPETKQQLEAAEVRFNAFRSRNGTVDVTKEGDLLLQQSVAAETGMVELQQKRKELLQRFTAEHPSIKAIDSQIVAIQAQRNKFAGQVDGLPQTQQEVLRLMRDLQVNQEIYTGLLNNTQQLKIVRGGTVGNVRIVDYAEKPLSPIAPQKAMILLLSLLAGLIAGVAAAFIRQALKSGVKNPKDIEARTGLSVFATIPYSPKQNELQRNRSRTSGKLQVLTHLDDQDLAVESLRSLRTTLHFATLDALNNRILVAGSAPSVGKSFISVNLGAVLVTSGERVLLIDADMRRGHINEYFGRPRDKGLSEVIAGVLPLKEAIYATTIPGLDLLTTGQIPPNPSELLLHPHFTELLSTVSAQYDRVIIDCPPILAVTDAAIVGRQVGTVLLAARFAVTPMNELEAAIARLRQAGVLINGILLNGVEQSAGNGYGYGYQYTYAYRSTKD